MLFFRIILSPPLDYLSYYKKPDVICYSAQEMYCETISGTADKAVNINLVLISGNPSEPR